MALRMTEQEVADLIARRHRAEEMRQEKTIPFAKGEPRRPKMNKTEAAYEQHLAMLQRIGDVLWFEYEGVTLKLAFDTRYTPDFVVLAKDHVLEMHEVKGFWEEDALIKIKVAARQFPFRFRAFQKIPQKEGGGWRERVFHP